MRNTAAKHPAFTIALFALLFTPICRPLLLAEDAGDLIQYSESLPAAFEHQQQWHFDAPTGRLVASAAGLSDVDANSAAECFQLRRIQETSSSLHVRQVVHESSVDLTSIYADLPHDKLLLVGSFGHPLALRISSNREQRGSTLGNAGLTPWVGRARPLATVSLPVLRVPPGTNLDNSLSPPAGSYTRLQTPEGAYNVYLQEAAPPWIILQVAALDSGDTPECIPIKEGGTAEIGGASIRMLSRSTSSPDLDLPFVAHFRIGG